MAPQTRRSKLHGDVSSHYGTYVIAIPKKVHRPKVVSEFECKLSYHYVNDRLFLNESFGKAMLRLKTWNATARYDFIVRLAQDIFRFVIK